MKTTVYRVLWWALLTIVSRVVSQKSKTSIFDSKPIRVQDYGTPPVTSTIPLYDCSGSHRPKLDIPGAYEVYHEKQWYLQSCQDGLVWNQTLCRCEFPNGRRLVVQCRDYRATSTEPTGKYEQLVNGQWIVRDCSLAVAGLVWDQEACQCVWGPDSKEMVTGQGIAPCEIMLNMTFENGVKDDAKGSYVEVGRGSSVPVFAVNKRESPDGYKAAYFTDTALNIWYFAGNEMGSSLRVEFRFKMTNDPVQRDKYQIFISNGCNISSPGYTTPSLAIGYRAADQSYLLAFETASARKAIVCTRKLGAYDWHTISLIYEDGTLLFRVDDQPCIISQDFSGAVQKTPCPLTIGADPLERESMYKGYLDNLLIARYCRRFIDTDPNESKDKKKGPMPVETAPTVAEFAFQQVRPKSDKQSSHTVPGRRQRAVTSTKYFPQLPSTRNSGIESGEHRAPSGDFLEKSMSADEFTRSFLRFPRSGDEGHGPFQGETSRREHGKGFSRQDTTDGQDNDYDTSEKAGGQADDYDKTEVSGKQANDYDNPGKNQGKEHAGYIQSKKNDDSRKEYSNSAKTNGRLKAKSADSDEETRQYSGSRQISRQVNTNKKFRKTEGLNGRFQNSGPTRRNDKEYVYSHDDEAYTSSTENNEHEKSSENAHDNNDSEVFYEHGNSRKSERQGIDAEKRNGFIHLEKRRGSKSESANNGKGIRIVTSRENRKNRERDQSLERFTKTDGSESDVGKSGRKSTSNDGNGWRDVQKTDGSESDVAKSGRKSTSNDGNGWRDVQKTDGSESDVAKSGRKSTSNDGNGWRDVQKIDGSESDVAKSGRKSTSNDGNGWRDVQKTDGYASKDGRAVNSDDDELPSGNGKNKDTKPGYNAEYGNKDKSEKPGGFDGYSKEGELVNGKNVGFRGDSDNPEKDEENVENYSKEKEEAGETRDNNEDYDYTRQTKEKEHGGENRKYDRSNKGKTRGNGKDKTRDDGRGKNNGGLGRTRGKTEEWQVYKGNGHDTVVSDLGTQEKGPSQSDVHSENFDGSKKDGFYSESHGDTESKITKITTSSTGGGHVAPEVSKYQDAMEDGAWEDDKKYEDSEEKDKIKDQNVAKSRPVRHDSGNKSKIDKQQNVGETGSAKETNADISSRESFSNLVKGRRRAGSKKHNWYDKVDVAPGKQKESFNSDEQNTQVEQSKKPPSGQTVVNKDTKKSGKVEIVYSKTHNLEYNRPSTSDKSYDSTKYKDDKVDRQKTRSSNVPGKNNYGGKGLRKPPAHGFIVKDYNENYEEDYESDQGVRSDDTTFVSRDSTDKRAQLSKGEARVDSNTDDTAYVSQASTDKRARLSKGEASVDSNKDDTAYVSQDPTDKTARLSKDEARVDSNKDDTAYVSQDPTDKRARLSKDEARVDSNTDDTADVSQDPTDKRARLSKDEARVDSNTDPNLPTAKNTEPKQTLKTNEPKHKKLDSSEQVKDNEEWHDQEKKMISVSTQGNVNDPEDVSGSHFNMPVDVTKIKSSRSVDVSSDTPQERTPDLSNVMKQSPDSSEKSKTVGH